MHMKHTRGFVAVLLASLAVSAYAASSDNIQIDKEVKQVLSELPATDSVAGALRERSVREQIITRKLFAQEGRKAKLDKTDSFSIRERMTSEQLLAQDYQKYYIEQHPPSEADVRALYEELKGRAGQTAYHVRQIFVTSESEANLVIASLGINKDEDIATKFAALAKAFSKDEATRNQGGDLGWLTPLQLQPQVVDTVTALKKGEFTRTPLKGSDGWHVILVEDLQPYTLDAFEKLKPQLQNQAARQKLLTHLSRLREQTQMQ